MLIGYARVSTADQDLALQTDALTKAGCERLFTDKASGAKADRPGLAEALHFACARDCIVVWKLDRLGRLIQGLISLAADLSARKVDFRSLTDGFDTSTASGRLLFHILASVAEMEHEQTVAGLAAARTKGGIGSGRKSVLTPDKLDTARKLLAAGTSLPRWRSCCRSAFRPSTATSRQVSGQVHSSFARTGRLTRFRVLTPNRPLSAQSVPWRLR